MQLLYFGLMIVQDVAGSPKSRFKAALDIMFQGIIMPLGPFAQSDALADGPRSR